MRSSAAVSVYVGAALLIFSGATYAVRLNTSPLAPTEGVIESQAIELAERRGHDRDGRPLPVFVHADGDLWLAPVPVYAAAMLTALAPRDVNHARSVAAMCGALDVLLLYLLVARWLRNRTIAVAAALVLLATPAHLVFSRSAPIDGVWHVPFILGWALGMTALADAPSRRAQWTLAAGAASLAGAMYTQPAAALIVPLLAATSMWIIARTDRWQLRDAVPAAGAFTVVLLPLAIWYARFPRTYVDTLGRWLLHPAHLRNPMAWMSALTNWSRAGHTAAVFWDFFAPSHLFLSPETPTRSGMFLTLTVVPVILGIRELLRRASDQPGTAALRSTLLAACSVGPLAAALFDQPRAEGRALMLVPFLLVVAAIGADAAWRSGGRLGRGVLVATGIGITVQAVLLQYS